MLYRVAVRCSVLRCVAACCSKDKQSRNVILFFLGVPHIVGSTINHELGGRVAGNKLDTAMKCNRPTHHRLDN